MQLDIQISPPVIVLIPNSRPLLFPKVLNATKYYYFFGPLVLMHGELLGITFCPSVCPSVTNTRKVTRKSISPEPFDLGSPNFGSKVKVTIIVKEKAGGLTPTSTCFILNKLLLIWKSGLLA